MLGDDTQDDWWLSEKYKHTHALGRIRTRGLRVFCTENQKPLYTGVSLVQLNKLATVATLLRCMSDIFNEAVNASWIEMLQRDWKIVSTFLLLLPADVGRRKTEILCSS
jgi:hypothetical protein